MVGASRKKQIAAVLFQNADAAMGAMGRLVDIAKQIVCVSRDAEREQARPINTKATGFDRSGRWEPWGQWAIPHV